MWTLAAQRPVLCEHYDPHERDRATIGRRERHFANARSKLRQAVASTPWNHPVTIISAPKCLTNVKAAPRWVRVQQSNAYISWTARGGWVSKRAGPQRSVCVA